ncbi:MAG: hypothetical protein H0U85_06040, partial [Gemmatimonadales bacterium]|nr:hypothetical protein [Gemmatimonadales bacterium]
TVAVGDEHSCGVRSGSVYCWGRNDFMQSLPDDLSGAAAVSIDKVTVPGTVERVFAGGQTTCAINADHEAYCWGSLNFEVAPRRIARVTRLMPGTRFTQLAISEDHACAIKDGGAVVCWGAASQQQLGQSNTMARVFDDPQPIEGPELFVALAAGTEATCGITVARKLVCWGSGSRGQLGSPSGAQQSVQIGTTQMWSRVAIGYNHTCAIGDGGVYCWGDNEDGALGNGTFISRRSLGMPILANATEITAGFGVTCALLSSGGARCWGSNVQGELGNGKIAHKREPALVALPAGTVRQIVAGDHHACALVGASSPYTAYCWGLNTKKQLDGTSAAVTHSTPVLVSTTTKFTQLAAGIMHTCGLAAGGSITCWGENGNSELGISGLTSLHTVNAPSSPWSYVAAGIYTTCAISAGQLYCWGAYPGLTGSPATPTNLGKVGSWEWSTISIGRGFAVGIVLNAGTPHLAAFATDANKCSAGFTSGATSTAPVEILSGLQPLGATAVVTAAQNGSHTCLQRNPSTTGIVTCWGNNNSKQLGVTTAPACGVVVEPISSPTWSATAAPSRLAVASDHSCAIAGDLSLYCWGSYDSYEVGSTPGGTAMPTPLFPGTNWVQIATGLEHTCGVQSDGKAYCWGANKYGEAGDGTQFEPAPVVAGIVP